MWELWQRALAWSKNSATHLVANVVVAGSLALELVATYAGELADLAGEAFGDPELKSQVLSVLPGKAAPVAVILIMLAVKRARDRTLPPKG